MTIREAIRAFLQEHAEAGTLDNDQIDWLNEHVQDCIDDELTEMGWVMDEISLEWSKP